MSKLDIIALSGVVYRVKNTCHSTEPCGTTYDSATLTSLLYGLVAIVKMRKKIPDIPYKSESLSVNVTWGQWFRNLPRSQARL